MRTITFEVEVDDEIIPSFVPNIYDEVFKQTPHGRLFLCKDKTSVAKKLVRLHRDTEAGGKEAPWFENLYLPDETRIVGMTGGNAAEYVNGKSKMMDELELEQSHFTADAPDTIPSSTLHDDHRVIIETVCGLSNVIDLINENVLNLMENQEANRDGMYAKFEDAFKHFKQVHQEHLDDCTHFAEVEERMTKRINEGSLHAANTANSVRDDILLALTNIEVSIKEYIGHPDPEQSAVSDDVTPQALLKAIEIVSGAMLRGAK